MLTWIELNAENLRHNFQQFAKLMGHDKLAPVLKSNAYGHGIKEIYHALSPEDPIWISVNYVEEGAALRGFGYKGRILVVGPFIPDEIKKAHLHKLEMFLGHEEGLTSWLQSREKPEIHIEFDTGMSRQGFRPSDADKIAERLLPQKNLVKGVCMHFANVEDVTEHDYAKLQLKKFEDSKAAFTKRGYNSISHSASSASVLILDESRFDLARFGIALYGFWPSQATRLSYKQLYGDLIDIKPVLSWRTKITSINHVAQGQYVGYGCTFKARHDMVIAVLPVGYYEGYPRMASGSQAYVLIHGERCPIVGRICMNMMMVDVSDIAKKIAVGDVVTLIGKDVSEIIGASDVATWSQTIHYELVTRLNPAIERRLV
jgi:alanine racemase